jgi:phosphoribosyl 1,2-cyclic phosphodiesterase
MIAFCVLASGSSGNAVLVRGTGGTVLLDAGLSAAQIGRRMSGVGVDLADLSAILLTHEHGDHIRGAPVLAEKLGIPVYLSCGTRDGSRNVWRRRPELHIVGADAFEIAGLVAVPVPLLHDAREPLGYRFSCGTRSLAVATDLGEADAVVEESLLDADALIVEANHDRDRLLDGPYPEYLKRRILSGYGHLSNDQCADLLRRVASPRLQRVVLAHLSQENNRPLLAWEAAAAALYERGVPENVISIASRIRPLGWMHVE